MRNAVVFVIYGCLFISSVYGQRHIAGRFEGVRYFPNDDNHISVAEFTEGLAPFNINAKDRDSSRVGFIDRNGDVKINAKYSNVSYFKHGYALVFIEDDKHRKYRGLINKNGREILKPVHQSIARCSNGLFLVRHNGKFGLMNPDGLLIVNYQYEAYSGPIPPDIQWDDSPPRKNGYYAWSPFTFYEIPFDKYLGLKLAHKWLIINHRCIIVSKTNFDAMYSFVGDMAPVKVGAYYGLTNSFGELVLPAQYQMIWLVGPDIAITEKGDKQSLVSLKKNSIIIKDHHQIAPFGSNRFLVRDSIFCGVIDLSGKTIVPVKFVSITNWGDGYDAQGLYRQHRLFDFSGNQIGPVMSRNDGVFPVWGNIDDGYWVYNNNDKRYKSYDFAYKYDFANGHHILFYQKQKKWGLMNVNGAQITEPVFDTVITNKLYPKKNDRYGLIIIKRDKKWGVINDEGKILLPAVYDEISPTDHGILAVSGRQQTYFRRELKIR